MSNDIIFTQEGTSLSKSLNASSKFDRQNMFTATNGGNVTNNVGTTINLNFHSYASPSETQSSHTAISPQISPPLQIHGRRSGSYENPIPLADMPSSDSIISRVSGFETNTQASSSNSTRLTSSTSSLPSSLYAQASPRHSIAASTHRIEMGVVSPQRLDRRSSRIPLILLIISTASVFSALREYI